MSPDQNHDEGEDEGEDWRSVSTRRPDTGSLSRARSRAREPGRGRTADDPAQIPALGWKDVLWRILYSFPRDRIFTTAGGVAFFTLLSTFPALATIVSVYSLFSDPHVISEHLSLLSGVLPSGVLALLSDQLIRVAQQSAGALSTASLVSVLIAFWSANSGVSALFDALNVIYREREKRSLVRFYATTFLFTLSGIVFALTATGLVVILPLCQATRQTDPLTP